MSTTNQTNDALDFTDGERPVLPSGLNVLTILTFIGCGLGLIGGIWQYINAEKGYQDLLKAQQNLSEAPAFVKSMMGPEMLEATRKSMEYKLPILLLTLVGVGLCLYGALEMRKLKKQGFALWAAGEFLPIIGAVIFVGTGMFTGLALFGLSIPVIFLILYAVNRKHLVY
jgi:hypothetical protein